MVRITPVTVALVLAAGSGAARAQEHAPDPAAQRALVELVESYRARPAITVDTDVHVEIRQGEAVSHGDDVHARITFAKGGRGRIELRGYTCWFGAGELIAIHEGTEHSYFSTPDDGSPYYALMAAFVDVPFPHLAIAAGEKEVDEFFCMQFHPKAPYVRPTEVADETREDGTVRRRLSLTSDHGRLDLVIDPERNLIETADLELHGGPFVQAGATMRYHHDFSYETFDEEHPIDPAVLTFDPGERQRVDMMASLMPRRAAPEMMQAELPAGLEGKPAPDLVLATSDGGAIDLEELRGQVVVIDFWATWCPPCRAALPLLHELAEWGRDRALPLTVITVNAYEGTARGEDSADARLEAVRDFWAKNGHTLPVAMDYTDEVARAYQVRGIPATFVIRADGTVHAQHSGAGPDYLDQLKDEVVDAIAALEAPADEPGADGDEPD